jgi:hypothetical protein
MVPVEQTAHMCHEGRVVGYGYIANAKDEFNPSDYAKVVYKAMLAAASPPPAAATGPVKP